MTNATGLKLVRATSEAWEEDLVKDRQGVPKPTVGNLITILKNHSDWRDSLAWDVFRRRPVWVRKPPFSADSARHGYASPEAWVGNTVNLDPLDAVRLQDWAGKRYRMECTKSAAVDALDVVSRSAEVNTLREYLEWCHANWDREQRVAPADHGSWLCTYLGVTTAGLDSLNFHEASDYIRLVGRYWLVSAVARAFRPGCQADHVLVLEGAQGISKSSALRALGGQRHFESLIDIDDKEGYMALAGVWLAEFSEGEAFSRSSVKRVKQFLTEPSDKYVPKYANEPVEYPRMWVPCSTVNPGGTGYLNDETGGRRFWPVPMKNQPRIDALARDVHQLWGEVVNIYMEAEQCLAEGESESVAEPNAYRDAVYNKDGTLREDAPWCTRERRCHKHRWWPSLHEKERLFKPIQEARAPEDVWKDVLGRIIADMPGDKVEGGLAAESLRAHLGVPQEKWTTQQHSRRLNSSMADLGFELRRVKQPEGQRRFGSAPKRFFPTDVWRKEQQPGYEADAARIREEEARRLSASRGEHS